MWWRLRRDRWLRSQLFWHSLSLIRRFSPLRMTKRGDARRFAGGRFPSYRQPSPRGEGFDAEIPLPPSNLRPFGAPPSVGRREYPREPLPLEGAAERSEAGLASFFAAKPPPLCLPGCVSGIAAFSYRSLPHWGRGTASAVDRVLSYIVNLRRSFPLFFIPLEPYPARSARHLPHAGKALFRRYCFSPRILYSI